MISEVSTPYKITASSDTGCLKYPLPFEFEGFTVFHMDGLVLCSIHPQFLK